MRLTNPRSAADAVPTADGAGKALERLPRLEAGQNLSQVADPSKP